MMWVLEVGTPTTHRKTKGIQRSLPFSPPKKEKKQARFLSVFLKTCFECPGQKLASNSSENPAIQRCSKNGTAKTHPEIKKMFKGLWVKKGLRKTKKNAKHLDHQKLMIFCPGRFSDPKKWRPTSHWEEVLLAGISRGMWSSKLKAEIRPTLAPLARWEPRKQGRLRSNSS